MTLFPYKDDHPAIDASVFVAPTAVLIGDVTVGEQSSIWFHTVIRADINAIRIGKRTNIQDGCLLHVTHRHALIIGDEVTAGHGAILHGCSIGNRCLIAMGAIVLDGATLEEECIVAAGAVIAPGTHIPKRSLVMGLPGKVVREVTDEDKERLMRGWHNYVGYAQSYMEQLRK